MRKRESEGEKILHEILPRFKLSDLLQVLIGASILAVPIGFTEETWKLGETLPMLNVFGLMILSISFIFMFTYYHYHKHITKDHNDQLIKRVVYTYLFSLFVVGIILTLIQRAPWSTDFLIAFKRVAIVSFPASMSAAIADTIR